MRHNVGSSPDITERAGARAVLSDVFVNVYVKADLGSFMM